MTGERSTVDAPAPAVAMTASIALAPTGSLAQHGIMTSPALIVAAVIFIGMGALALVAPARLGRLVGFEASPRRGINEIRAVYGGFGVCMAALLVAVADDPTLRPGVCLTLALALFGMAGGRVVSAAVERGVHPLMVVIALAEAGLGFWLFMS